jgi:hypothetical protein
LGRSRQTLEKEKTPSGKKMKTRSWSFAIALACLAIHSPSTANASQAASAGVSPITVALSTTSARFNVDMPIPVIVTLTNTGTVPINLEILDAPDGAYRSLGLRFALAMNGKEVEKTAFHRAIRHESLRGDPSLRVDGTDTYTMKPGEVDHIKIDVKKLFSITQPGSYLFSVVMPVNMDNKVEIHSPPLALNVVP